MANPSRKQKAAAKKIQDMIFTNLDLIYKTCEISAHKFGAKSVPLEFLKICIDESKKAFEAGAKQKSKA